MSKVKTSVSVIKTVAPKREKKSTMFPYKNSVIGTAFSERAFDGKQAVSSIPKQRGLREALKKFPDILKQIQKEPLRQKKEWFHRLI